MTHVHDFLLKLWNVNFEVVALSQSMTSWHALAGVDVRFSATVFKVEAQSEARIVKVISQDCLNIMRWYIFEYIWCVP